MPCIQMKTNVKVNEEAAQAIKSQLGKEISLFPGKSEQWLMVTLEDDCRIWFRGETGRPMAMVEVKIYGSSVDSAAAEKMTGRICSLLQNELGIDPADVYVAYAAVPDWGWNCGNF